MDLRERERSFALFQCIIVMTAKREIETVSESARIVRPSYQVSRMVGMRERERERERVTSEKIEFRFIVFELNNSQWVFS